MGRLYTHIRWRRTLRRGVCPGCSAPRLHLRRWGFVVLGRRSFAHCAPDKTASPSAAAAVSVSFVLCADTAGVRVAVGTPLTAHSCRGGPHTHSCTCVYTLGGAGCGACCVRGQRGVVRVPWGRTLSPLIVAKRVSGSWLGPCRSIRELAAAVVRRAGFGQDARCRQCFAHRSAGRLHRGQARCDPEWGWLGRVFTSGRRIDLDAEAKARALGGRRASCR